MRQECDARASLSERLSKKMTEVLEPLREVLKSEGIASKSQSKSLEQARKEVGSYKDRLEMAQDCYWMQFQATEELVTRIENAATLVEKRKLVKFQPSDINQKMELATKAYREALSAYNQHIPHQQEFISTLLSSLKMQKEERLSLLSTALQKIHTINLEGLATLHTLCSSLTEVPSPTGIQFLLSGGRPVRLHVPHHRASERLPSRRVRPVPRQAESFPRLR